MQGYFEPIGAIWGNIGHLRVNKWGKGGHLFLLDYVVENFRIYSLLINKDVYMLKIKNI